MGEIGLYTGSAHPELLRSIAQYLGEPVGRLQAQRFPDGEVGVQLDESVRGQDVFILQPTGPPVNEHLMELLILLDTFKRASPRRITALMPYYGYSRQEKKSAGREPISARLVADLLTTAGAQRVVSIDLHAPAIQGFFNIGMDHLTGVPILVEHLLSLREADMVVVAPDTGRVKLADRYASALDLPLVVLHKRRWGPEQVETRVVVGEVAGRRPVVIDDIISSGGTIRAAIEALLQAGANAEVLVAATHGIFVGRARERLAHPAIREIVVTDTLPQPPPERPATLRVCSVAGLLAQTIDRLHRDESISALFPPRFDQQPV